jgi:hypothetical protein
MKRLLIGTILLFALLWPVAAREVRQGDQCAVPADEVVQGNLFVLCRSFVLNGTVEGNLIGAATRADIKGTVGGGVYLLAGQLDVDGSIGKDLHFAGPVLRVQPAAKFTSDRADLLSVSLSSTVAEGAVVPNSITALGYQLVLDGSTGGEVNFWGSALRVNGDINGDVDANVGDSQSSGISQLQTLLIPFGWDVELINPGLTITERGSIGGGLNYTGPTEGQIEGKVSGSTLYNPVISQPSLPDIINEPDSRETLYLYLGQVLREFLTLALIGAAALALVPRALQTPLRNLQTRPLSSLGVGLLTFIVSFPVFLLILFFCALIAFVLLVLHLDNLLFIPALLGVLNIGAGSTFYFIAIYVTRALACLLVGTILMRAFAREDGSPRAGYIGLAIGAILLAFVAFLPVIGLITNAVAAFMGLGAILIVVQSQMRAYRDAAPVPVARPSLTARRVESVPQIPPPVIDYQPRPLGMDNLPEGFKWWDDD